MSKCCEDLHTPLGVTRLELRNEARNSASAEFRASFRSSSRVTPRGSRLSRAKFEIFFKNFKFFFKTNNSKIFLKHNKYNITLVKQQNFDSFAIKEIDFFQKFNNSKFIPNYYSSFIHNNKSYLEIQYFSQGNLLNFIENISLTYNTNQINQYKQFKFNYIKQMIQILYFLKKKFFTSSRY